jgi:phage-related protein
VLVNAGEEIISGLINGITSQLGHLGSVLGGVGSFIKEHKGPASVDRVMLVPAGQMIMDGLIHGFESRLPNVKSSLGAITAALPGAVSPGGSGGGAGVQIENFYATDMDEAVRKLTAQQRDAAIVENVRLALVG